MARAKESYRVAEGPVTARLFSAHPCAGEICHRGDKWSAATHLAMARRTGRGAPSPLREMNGRDGAQVGG